MELLDMKYHFDTLNSSEVATKLVRFARIQQGWES
jgi:hypothetical protein